MHFTNSTCRASLLAGVAALAALGAAAFVPTQTRADVDDRLYEFTDAFYTQNGIDPATIGGRRQADGRLAVQDNPFFAYQRNVRALLTVGGWTDGGAPVYYTVLGELSGNSFLSTEAGRRALQVADRSPEYIFPARGTNPTGLGSVRQPFMVDLRGGYFSNNPLGLWIHTFVNYTDNAFNTRDGQKALNDLAQRNGLGLDGTPIIRTASEIDSLYKKGYVTKLTLPLVHRDAMPSARSSKTRLTAVSRQISFSLHRAAPTARRSCRQSLTTLSRCNRTGAGRSVNLPFAGLYSEPTNKSVFLKKDGAENNFSARFAFG